MNYNINIYDYLNGDTLHDMKIYDCFLKMEKYYAQSNIIKKSDLFIDTDNLSIIEMRKLVSTCLSDEGVKYIINRYDLSNRSYGEDNLTLQQFAECAKKILKKYKSMELSDNEWTYYDSNCTKYDLFENEAIFENTIHANFINDNETHYYLKHIVRLLNTISNNVSVTIHKKYCERDKIYIIMIKCVEYISCEKDDVTN